MDDAITDTVRLDFLAGKIARAYGSKPESFREHLDTQIRQSRAAESVWIDLTAEFPRDETPVCVQAVDGREGIVCYDSVAGDWYMHYPGSDLHGRLWTEVYGGTAEIVRWHPAKA